MKTMCPLYYVVQKADHRVSPLIKSVLMPD